MKKIQDILISTRTMASLLLIFAISMAVATFIENDYGTPTAKALIYEAKWFEAVMFLLILNFIGNIGRYRLYKREKWPILVFHLAFVLIFIGGAITRYISFEGTMHIREGETNNEIITDKHFFKIKIEEKGDQQNYHDVPYLMSPLHHDFQATYDFLGKEKIVVKALDYIQRKKDSLVVGNGKEFLHLVSTGDMGGRQNIYLAQGEVQNINGTLVSYNRTSIDGAVEFQKKDGQLYIKTPVDAAFMTMATKATGTTTKDEFQPLALRSLYTIDQLKLVIPEGTKTGKLVSYEGDKQKDKDVPDMLRVEVAGPKTKQIVDLVVEKGNPNNYKQIKIDGLDVMLGFGPKIYFTQPFALKLEKFVMETYPGSSSPSAYESHVKIVDEGKETPYNIYMNHVLNYKGYRFFQASFDPDRKGTVLSVNHDFWGTLISYIGYGFLFIGMFVTMFWKCSRFWSLNQMLKTISKKKATMILLLLLSFGLNAQEIDMHGKDGSHEGYSHSTEAAAPTSPNKNPAVIDADAMVKNIEINKEHADKFGYLLVQNYEGRIVPANTQALDILHKLTSRSTFQNLDANQWFLAATIDPMFWAQVNIIKIETAGKVGKDLREKTKATDEGFTSLIKLFPADKNGNLRFVLEDDYNDAFRKKASERTRYDEAVIKLNDKVQVLNGIMSYQYFRTVPVKNDSNHTWSSVMTPSFEPDQNAQDVLGPYLSSVLLATQGGSWAKADAELKKVEAYQQKWGKNVVPSENKVKLEVLMNALDINFKLLIFYTIIGSLLLVLGFVELFRTGKIINRVIKVIIYIGVIGYIFHFLGLISRWYISGHAPWSNGYEAIIFISWVGISAGLMFYFGIGKPSLDHKVALETKNLIRKNNANALVPAAGFLVAVIMMGFAHGGSALDPQITPLVPVLKSYWLVVHVAIITSSYGFFSLSMLIAMISLIFYIIANKATFVKHNDTTLKELAIVSEMSLNIGLLALTIGNFLGGIWANESWGRYWSWDPKETWAFISIMIYAFVIHMRLVPGLRGRYTFHVVTMFAFCSMVMTYFGVNYYLSGLHSYAKGDPIPLPLWVYISLGYMIVLSIAAWFKYKKLNEKQERRTQVEP